MDTHTSILNRPRVKPDELVGEFPHVPVFEGEQSLDAASIAKTFLKDFEEAVVKGVWNAFADLFAPDTWWRDHLTLTFDRRTLHGKDEVVAAWKELVAKRPVSAFGTSAEETYGMAPHFARSQWKIWVLATAADHLVDSPFAPLPRKNDGVIGAGQCGKVAPQGLPKIKNGAHLDAVIIGGSAAGTANAIMLRSAGADVVMLDVEDTPGGLWSNHRYESFVLHHGKLPSSLPMILPDEKYNEYMTGKQLNAYMTDATEKFQLPFFGGVKVISNTWSDATKEWKVLIEDIRSGEQMTLKAKNIVMANGFLIGNETPFMPKLTDRDVFHGPVEHSTVYHTAKEYIGKDVVVVGAGNSGHDIAEDLSRSGARSVTILQKNPIIWADFEKMMAVVSFMYQGQMSVEAADFQGNALPLAIARQMMIPALKGLIDSMGETNKVLEEAGYMLNKNPDMLGAAFNSKGKNFFMDQPGLFDLIAKKKIKHANGEAVGFTPDGLVIKKLDSAETFVLPAQGVVLATGYEVVDLPARWAKSGFVDAESAAKLENVNRFGFDKEGELPGFTTFSGHEHLYFSGIGFLYNRAIARFTAIQIMADKLGEFPERLRR
ncbi:putative indole-3-pyruvate monooxygenase YUCCA10 [Cyphellophora attinorum]|uniref:Putative indole-3-pyruvate monooxygenase YUCCA10 n=1 Tax=Cyphellophora attinorum TaxID=1664694 RepID=A0A0N1HXB0_9EURO|nr:putative indole-3-pyruvate monooxygenase YUCCA10 [Phialophora attinorum]KPI45127.1 putative indole-3-pyruvate monooxygenase YUCCA10 [Phialophora attinorum]